MRPTELRKYDPKHTCFPVKSNLYFPFHVPRAKEKVRVAMTTDSVMNQLGGFLLLRILFCISIWSRRLSALQHVVPLQQRHVWLRKEMETYVEEEKDDQLCKNPNCKALNLSSSHPGCLLVHRWTHICVCVSCWDSFSFTLSYTSTISTQLTTNNSQ